MEDDDDDLLSSLVSRLQSVAVTSQEDLARTFASELGIGDVQLAQFFLSAANNNLEVAVNLWLDSQQRRGAAAARGPPRRRAPSGVGVHRTGARGGRA
jgi:hypothetical protein